MCHANNARVRPAVLLYSTRLIVRWQYPRSADFARYQLWKLNGVFKALGELNGYMVLGAHTIRFRRSLDPFEAFKIK